MQDTSPVRELRVALTVDDFAEALAFYRDVLGLPVRLAWDEPTGKGAILEAGAATLELLSADQAELVDQIEVGRRVAAPVRLALARRGAGDTLGRPERTRPRPDGMQLTLFTVLGDADQL